MRKILQRNEKVELNSFIDEFVKARQKYFTPGQEWLEAELAEEKISVYMDKAQLEKDLDELVKTSLMYGKVRNLEMKIQVKKTADGAGICFSDNGVGNWRNKSICVTGKPGRGLETKKIWGVLSDSFLNDCLQYLITESVAFLYTIHMCNNRFCNQIRFIFYRI